MTAEEEGRKKAKNMYRIVIGFMGIISGGLLTCGIIAAASHTDSGSFGPPYFLGGFSAGILGLLYVCVCIYIFIKIPCTADLDEIKKREIACAMTGQYILSMFMFFACFLGLVFAGMGGLSSPAYGEDDRDPAVKTLAICILLGCLLALALTICGMCTVCMYGSYFGVRLNQRRGRQVLVLHTDTGGLPANYNTSTAVSNNQIQSLETQNRLLQQQIQLQQQLQLQKQQMNQQQLSTDPVYPPPPPPAYA